MKHRKYQCCAKKHERATHTHPPLPVSRRSHGEVIRNPMYPAAEACISRCTKPAFRLSAKKTHCIIASPIWLAHTLEVSCFQSSATWFNSSLQPKWPPRPTQALGFLPAEEVQQAWWSLQSTKPHKPKTSADSDPELTSGSCAFPSQTGWWGFSPQRLCNSHGEGKCKAKNSCCGQPEHHSKYFRACLCCQFLKQVQRNSRISPGSYLHNWDQNYTQAKRKNPQEPFVTSLLPAPEALVPLHARQREESANHNTGKNVLPASSGLSWEEQLLFSRISHCYCLMGGEKRRSGSISGGGRKWWDCKAWSCSCLLWSESFQLSRALCQYKNSEHVTATSTPARGISLVFLKTAKRKMGWKPPLLTDSELLEAEAQRNQAA